MKGDSWVHIANIGTVTVYRKRGIYQLQNTLTLESVELSFEQVATLNHLVLQDIIFHNTQHRRQTDADT